MVYFRKEGKPVLHQAGHEARDRNRRAALEAVTDRRGRSASGITERFQGTATASYCVRSVLSQELCSEAG